MFSGIQIPYFTIVAIGDISPIRANSSAIYDILDRTSKNRWVHPKA